MTPAKRQPNGLLTGSIVFMSLAVVMAVLSGDLLLLLAVGCAIAGVMVLSRLSPKPVPSHVHVASARYDAVESRHAVPAERVVVYATSRTVAKSIGSSRLRSRRAVRPRNQPYVVGADAVLPVIQVLR